MNLRAKNNSSINRFESALPSELIKHVALYLVNGKVSLSNFHNNEFKDIYSFRSVSKKNFNAINTINFYAKKYNDETKFGNLHTFYNQEMAIKNKLAWINTRSIFDSNNFCTFIVHGISCFLNLKYFFPAMNYLFNLSKIDLFYIFKLPLCLSLTAILYISIAFLVIYFLLAEKNDRTNRIDRLNGDRIVFKKQS